jgi:PAS domain S-box-containing protein
MSAHPLGTVRVMAQEHGAERARPSAEVPQEYRAIFEAVTDGLVITDLATARIVEVNPALCRMHGYQRDELIGSLTTTIIHPGDHPLFTDFADAIQHGHEFRARRRDLTKDGRVFEVEVRGIQLPLRGKPHMLGVVRDITEEAAAYRLLEERVAGRTHELSGLLAVARRLAAVVDPADIQSTLSQEAGGVLTRSAFAVWRLEEGCLVPVTAGERRDGSRWPGSPRRARCSRPGSLSAAVAPKPTARCTPSSPAPGSSPPGPPMPSSSRWWRPAS